MRILSFALLSLLAGCGGDNLLLPEDGRPTQLRAVSGDGQTAVAGDPVSNPLVVEALDRAKRPVPGAAVIFEFVTAANGAAIAPATTETNDDGLASASVTLGNAVGDQPVRARLAEPGHPGVEFLLTALQPNRGGGGGKGGGNGGGNGGDDDNSGPGHGGHDDDDDD